MNANEPTQGKGLNLPFLRSRTQSSESNRLPFARWMPDTFRHHFVSVLGECTGTVLFLLFGFSATQMINNLPSTQLGGGNIAAPAHSADNPTQLLYIALTFGCSTAVNAWVFFRISGALFNPAVTLGMCLVGALTWMRGLLVFFAQIVGAIIAAAITSCLFPGELNVQTTLGPGTSITQGLFIEMFLAAELIFTIFMLAAEKHRGTYLAPLGVGLSVFIIELTGVPFTGGSANPARSFGPAVVAGKFPDYHWIYWLGPCMGAVLAAGLYRFMKVLEYETANPGADHDGAKMTLSHDLESNIHNHHNGGV